MKTSLVRFAQLRRLLLDLHFNEARSNGFWRYEHSGSGTVFLFRPYALDDNVAMQDLASTRTHLDWRGVLSSTVFDDSLTKTPA